MNSGKKKCIFQQLINLLAECRLEKNSKNQITHTGLGDYVGSYNISGDKYNRFMDLYCKVIKKINNNEIDKRLHIVERHIENGPIVIDIDIKYNKRTEDNTHIYTKDQIKRIIEIYNNKIQEILDIKEIDVYLLEKPNATLKKQDRDKYEYKDGVHIIYPNIITTPIVQQIIRYLVIQEIKQDNELLDMFKGNDLNEVFDESVIIRNGITMYGSCKPDSNNNYYKLTQVYDQNLEETIDEYDEDDIFNLPKTLSLRNNKELTKYNEDYTEEKIKDIYNNITIGNGKKGRNADEIRIALLLLEILDVKRSDDYNKWMELGWCLHNISETLLINWIEFSRNSEKYKEGECEKKWNGFREYGFTIRSLHYWARKDNLNAYSELILKENNQIFTKSLIGNEAWIAKAFFSLYQYDYKYVSDKNKEWYEFKDHRWCRIDGDLSILKKINEELCNKYFHLSNMFSNLAIATTEEDERSKYKDNMSLCLKIINKLGQINFKKRIVSELAILFHDAEFYDKIDENRDLLCFTNGVYDLKYDFFREGRPEDYITLSTKIEYKPYNQNDYYIKKTEQFLKDIQPDESMYNYIIDLMASCLQGHTPDEKFHIWTGTGGNGKSLCINLLMKALGDYACTLPITILTSKRPTATSANPEIAKTKGKRFCVFQEPEYNDKIYVGYMKELSGGDKVSARALYKEPVEFIPQFKLVLTCNNLPDIPANDGGTWRRLRVVEFGISFVDKPKKKNEKKKDPKFKQELPQLKEALMSLLIDRFRIYKENGLIEPDQVTSYTNKYKQDSDKFNEFIKRCLKPKHGNILSMAELYKYFNVWYKEFYNEKSSIPRKDFESNILNNLGNFFINSKLHGFEFNDESEDNLEINVIPEDITLDSNILQINTIITSNNNNNNNNNNKNKNNKNNKNEI